MLSVLSMSYADVAQLAEQLTCNQQVIGSSPIIGFFLACQQERNETEAHKQKITTLQEVGFSSCRKKTVPLFFIRFLAQCRGIMRRKLINKK